MFVEPTVFILGAGASYPYGYPTGNGLTKHILSPLRSKNFRDTKKSDGEVEQSLKQHFDPLLSILEEAGPWANKTIAFRTWRTFLIAFHRSSFQTIDQFIGARPEFADIGKILIANKLLDDEHQWVWRNRMYADVDDEVKDEKREIDFWYKAILHHLPPPGQEQNLRVVTFNYDLSFQNALYEHATYAFGLKSADASRYVESIPFISVYGTVGKLHWQVPNGREYGEANDDHTPKTERIIDAAKSITTISESASEDIFQQARDLIESSLFKFILGFGFHYENCMRIGLKSLLGLNHHAYGVPMSCASSFFMTKADRTAITHNFKVTFDQPEECTAITKYLRNCDSFRMATGGEKRSIPPFDLTPE